jgi:hypothetical protein
MQATPQLARRGKAQHQDAHPWEAQPREPHHQKAQRPEANPRVEIPARRGRRRRTNLAQEVH